MYGSFMSGRNMQMRGGARNQLPEAIARAVTIDGGGKRDSYEQPEEIYEMQSGQPRVLDFSVNNLVWKKSTLLRCSAQSTSR
jgi:hypothetical protein